jgi:hypothetical protein
MMIASNYADGYITLLCFKPHAEAIDLNQYLWDTHEINDIRFRWLWDF